MNKEEKQQTVESLGEQFRSLDSAFLINYKGLKVVDATELRRKIREIDGCYVVVKNTLALLAAKQTKLEQLEALFRRADRGGLPSQRCRRAGQALD